MKVLFEEVVAMFPRQTVLPARPAKREMPRPKRERGSDRRVGGQKLDATSLELIPPTMEWMAVLILASKARKEESLASSSETRAS